MHSKTLFVLIFSSVYFHILFCTLYFFSFGLFMLIFFYGVINLIFMFLNIVVFFIPVQKPPFPHFRFNFITIAIIIIKLTFITPIIYPSLFALDFPFNLIIIKIRHSL